MLEYNDEWNDDDDDDDDDHVIDENTEIVNDAQGLRLRVQNKLLSWYYGINNNDES
jgi:hypothetical protein